MDVRELQDFILQVGPRGAAGDYHVTVLESPAGQASGRFVDPFSDEILRAFTDQLAGDGGAADGALPAPPHGLVRRPSEDADGDGAGTGRGAAELGGELFEAVFTGPVRDAFLRSLERVRAAGEGLRLRIRLDPDDPDAARLEALPWEFLYRRDTREFLSRSRRTPVVRELAVDRSPSLPELPRRLRVLVVLSSPAGWTPLDLERERRALARIWQQHAVLDGDIVPRPGCRATPQEVRRRLLEAEREGDGFHVLHFMGHGALDGETGEGRLAFEDAHGHSDPVSGEALADLLRDAATLRLVVLNACHSASAAAARHPFTGVGTALVREGVPAVVAMRTAIADEAAVAFSRELYHGLASGDALDAAMTEARRAIGRPGHTDAWGTPVLFLRSRASRLFAEPGESAPPPSAVPDPRPARRAPRAALPAVVALVGLTAALVVAVVVALALGIVPGGGNVADRDSPIAETGTTVGDTATGTPSGGTPAGDRSQKPAPLPELVMAPIENGTVGVGALDATTREWDGELAGMLFRQLRAARPDLRPVIVSKALRAHLAALQDGDLSILPGGERSPDGLEHLFFTVAEHGLNPAQIGPYPSVRLDCEMVLVATREPRLIFTELFGHSGQKATRKAALEKAVENCVEESALDRLAPARLQPQGETP